MFILLYFSLLVYLQLWNENAKVKERRSWVPVKIWKSENAEVVNAEWCCFLLSTQFSEN